MGKKIAIGGDHAGFEYKGKMIQKLQSLGFEVKDFGPFSTDSVDYPDYVHPLSSALENGEFDLGIVICGSGNGINMTVNKHQGIRGALCWKKEIAQLAREHNDANILTLPARFISVEEALEMVDIFWNTAFEGGRHQKRVEKIAL